MIEEFSDEAIMQLHGISIHLQDPAKIENALAGKRESVCQTVEAITQASNSEHLSTKAPICNHVPFKKLTLILIKLLPALSA
jgi:hypothetical protein